MKRLIRKYRQLSPGRQALITLVALALAAVCAYLVDALYAASLFPATHFEQQSSFDAAQMKQWYAYMLEQGTLRYYRYSQGLDFALILTLAGSGFCLWTLLANVHPPGTLFRQAGLKVAFLPWLAGGFDILENLISFFMLARPTDFADTWVTLYSTFALSKFICWLAALLFLGVSLLALPFNRYRWRQQSGGQFPKEKFTK